MQTKATTIDEFLADVPDERRAALEELRKQISAAAPDATEGINYGVPAFKLHGRPLVSFAAAKNHCSFYVQSPAVMRAHAAELKGYETTKGAVHFSPEKRIPADLVTKLVRARIAENEKRGYR